MSQPPPYSRSFSFTNFQAQNPTAVTPGNSIDLELNNAKATLDATLANLALIQRDDGALANDSVGLDQLSAQVTVGFNAPVVWVTGTSYTAVSSTVFNGSGFYQCLISHTSGVFATDLAAGKWTLIVNLAAVPLVNASQIAVTPSGSLTSQVQTSLQALDSGKAPTSHTHVSTQISDSTTAGRAMLTAANLAAQQALLGLGSLAFLSTVPVTQINANLAFINPIAGSLVGSINDWSPTGWATATVVKMTTSGPLNITGFAATTDGDFKILQNTSANAVTLLFESTASNTVNRIQGPTWPNNLVLLAGAALALQYDGAAARWRLLSPVVQPPQQAIAGGFRNLICGNVTGNSFTAPGTPNTSFKITADAISLEDASGNMVRLNGVSVTPDTGTTGANGFDGTGSLVSAPLFAFIIYNPTTAAVAGLLSRSATAPTMPAGYTFKIRVGATYTDGSSHLLRTIQYGNRLRCSTSVSNLPQVVSANQATTTSTSFSVAGVIPTTAAMITLRVFGQTNGVGPSYMGVAPTAAGALPNTQPFSQIENGTNGNQVNFAAGVHDLHLEGTAIFVASLNMSGVDVAVAGWIDNL